MHSDHFQRFRRASTAVKIGVAVIAAWGILSCIIPLSMHPHASVSENYMGFMLTCAVGGVLPAGLMALSAGSTQYESFELVRRDPREQLRANLLWSFIVGALGAAAAFLIFSIMEFAVFGQSLTASAVSLALLLTVQTFMMIMSVSLSALLFVCLGIPWGQFLPVIIGVMILASWLLAPLAGNAARYAYYFWYPISPSWSVVAVQQIVPFIGYCVLMSFIDSVAFNRTDRLA